MVAPELREDAVAELGVLGDGEIDVVQLLPVVAAAFGGRAAGVAQGAHSGESDLGRRRIRGGGAAAGRDLHSGIGLVGAVRQSEFGELDDVPTTDSGDVESVERVRGGVVGLVGVRGAPPVERLVRLGVQGGPSRAVGRTLQGPAPSDPARASHRRRSGGTRRPRAVPSSSICSQAAESKASHFDAELPSTAFAADSCGEFSALAVTALTREVRSPGTDEVAMFSDQGVPSGRVST